MRISDGGYSEYQFDRAQLLGRVADLSLAIPELLARTGASHIAVTGKSGISMAFAALARVPFHLIVVRKDGEQTHGNRIEGAPGVPITGILILDDFVSSGATLLALYESVRTLCEMQDEPVPRFLGCVLHAMDYGSSPYPQREAQFRLHASPEDSLYKFGPRYYTRGRADAATLLT